MSLEESLEHIIDEKHPSDGNHKVTRYRRRDLRNSLANRIGKGRPVGNKNYKKQLQYPAKKRVKISKIPLDVSDFVIEDMLKEFGEPTYFNIYDTKDDRIAMCEFPDLATMESVVSKFDLNELNNTKIAAEILELKGGQDKRKKGMGGNYNPIRHRNERNSQYVSSKDSSLSGKTTVKPKMGQTTVEDLDAELEAYMNK